MPFKKMPGFPGKVYVPEQNLKIPKKNNCIDCFSCQMCGDERCRVCLNHSPLCKNIPCKIHIPSDEDRHI